MQVYLFDPVTRNYLDTIICVGQPDNSCLDFPTIPIDFARRNDQNTEWFDRRTVEEINSERKEIYRSKIYQQVSRLNFSADERILDKVGHNLTQKELDDLRFAYHLKNLTALAIINGAEIIDDITYSNISNELEDDWNGEKLTQLVSILNSIPGVSIPTDVSRLIQYAHVINEKYKLGEKSELKLKSLIEYFRSKMIAWLNFENYDKIEQGEALVKTILPSFTNEDFLNLKNTFDLI